MAWLPERQRPTALAVGLLLVLGLFFRFYRLEEKLLWHDELATRVFAAGYTVEEWQHALYTGAVLDVAEAQQYQRHNPTRTVWAGIRGLAEDDPQHPPLYYVLTRVWVSTFGDGIGTLRALSALFSALSLLAMVWLARELFDEPRAVWMSVALYAVSPFFVLYAQEAREYALWTLWILLSNASLLWAIRDGRPRSWATFSLITVLALYTSFTSASVIISQLVYLVVRERGRPTAVAKRSFLAFAAAAVAFLPWFFTLLEHYAAFEITMRWSREIIIPVSALFRILGHNFSRTIVDFWPELVSPLSFAVMGLAVTLLVAALLFTGWRAPRDRAPLVLLLVLIPIGMLLGPDLVSGGIRSISMRYLTPAWVAVLLALGYFLGTLPSRRLGNGLAALVIAASLGSNACNAGQVSVWTKATSVSLPKVAELINAEPQALLVGNLERHSAGNLMALSILLKPGTKMQFQDAAMEKEYVLPRQYGAVFLFNPIPDYRVAMEARERVTTRLLLEDNFSQLWKVETATTAH